MIKQIRLLLVDDEQDFRNTLAKRLSKRGITALQAASGNECLKLLADHPVDVVVMDVKMPGISGLEVLHKIREMAIPTEVILLTGHSATQDGVEGIKLGAFDYLSKPVEFEHLLGKITQAYDKILAEHQSKEAAEFKARIEQQMIATERLAALGTLAAGVAHEINNPLAIINEAAGYLRMLFNKKTDNELQDREKYEKALEKIELSVQRARNITHQLLGSVRKSDSVLVELDIAALVEETLQLMGSEAKNKNIEVAVNTDRNLKTLWIDPNQVRQILINLISNAIHATPAQGRIAIGLDNTANGISIRVEDTGTGIPKEHMEKIFEPFFSTKSPGQGTGLGLFVTREIVEKLNGNIKVHSRFGHGARFTVQIPDQALFEDTQNSENNKK